MKIVYYSWLVDEVGCEEEEVTLPPDVTNVGMLIDWLSARGPQYEKAFKFIEVVKVMVNQAYAHDDQPLKDDDEVMLMPPIAGG